VGGIWGGIWGGIEGAWGALGGVTRAIDV
jgi:hypothetical protein